MNNQGLWEAGFVVSKGWSAPWSLQEDVIGFWNNSVGWLGTETHCSGIGRKYTWSLWLKGLFSWGTLSVGADLREALAVRAIHGPPVFTRCQGSTQYWALIFGLTLQNKSFSFPRFLLYMLVFACFSEKLEDLKICSSYLVPLTMALWKSQQVFSVFILIYQIKSNPKPFFSLPKQIRQIVKLLSVRVSSLNQDGS